MSVVTQAPAVDAVGGGGDWTDPDQPTQEHPPADRRAPITLVRPMPSSGWRGWWGPLLAMLVAGLLRFPGLGSPHAIVFDETYYAKDALGLLRFGYERSTVDDANDLILGSRSAWNQLDIFTADPTFVVHPPLGKWLIGAGEWMFGVTPFGWRFAMALMGTLSVLMLARVVRRLTRSDVIGTLAGLLLALDGLHIVLSRTAVLDLALMFFVLAAFGCLLLDRDAVRSRVAAADPDQWWGSRYGPRLGLRPWRLAAGVCLGLACGVKWSGLWYVAFFGLLCVWWDVALRRQLGVRRPFAGAGLRDVGPALVSIVGLGFVVYLTTWTGWLSTSGGWGRSWAADHPGAWPLVPDALRSLAEYHRVAWNFHVSLHSPHSYQSSAWSWPMMTRPTSFYVDREGACGADRCMAEVLAVGNPVIWWAGVLALGHNVWRAVGGRDWRSGALVVGYLAGWLPWLVFHDRTIFTFYAIVMLPFLVGMLAISLAALAGGPEASTQRRRWGLILAGLFLLAVIAAAWHFMPIWTGEQLTYDQWRDRMWMPTWV